MSCHLLLCVIVCACAFTLNDKFLYGADDYGDDNPIPTIIISQKVVLNLFCVSEKKSELSKICFI